MLQALIRKGKVRAEEVPAPVVQEGRVLIRVVNSCISAGTEMAGVSSTAKSAVSAMMEQPEKIRKVFNLIRSEGLRKLLDQYKFIKESGQPTGYSVSGIIVGMGENVHEFSIGDEVAAAGGGYAYHAEFVEVPKNLVVHKPANVDFGAASTVALGAIALHGVRRVDLKIGEFGVVLGTGILGLLAVQILSKSGVRVIAVDINTDRLNIASTLGAEFTVNSTVDDPVKSVENITRGTGTDAVLFSAATSESKPLSQAFQMCRKKGKVVLMGVSGMELNRKDIYPGELDLQISTSYGPGRYDKNYEENGIDYPLHYVRWTERRNFEEYMRLLGSENVRLDRLINHIYPIENAESAFESLNSTNKPVIVLLNYGLPATDISLPLNRKLILRSAEPVKSNTIRVGIIGIGNFAQSVHIPNLRKLSDKYSIKGVASQSGVKAKNTGDFYGVKYATTDYEEIFKDPEIDLVMICTRHGNHAALALKALKAGKNVFVEKPLATNESDLRKIEDYFSENSESSPLLMVGFNRRFSPYINEIKKHTNRRIGPLYIHYRMNAGYQPADHWTHQDGGRIIGEACHLIDLIGALTNSRITDYQAENIGKNKGKFNPGDNKSILLKYEDGSLATIEYTSMGSRSLAKEYMEIHFDEKSLILDDFKSLKSYGIRMNNMNSKLSQKGHLEELKVFHEFLTGQRSGAPADIREIIETTRTAIAVGNLL